MIKYNDNAIKPSFFSPHIVFENSSVEEICNTWNNQLKDWKHNEKYGVSYYPNINFR